MNFQKKNYLMMVLSFIIIIAILILVVRQELVFRLPPQVAEPLYQISYLESASLVIINFTRNGFKYNVLNDTDKYIIMYSNIPPLLEVFDGTEWFIVPKIRARAFSLTTLLVLPNSSSIKFLKDFSDYPTLKVNTLYRIRKPIYVNDGFQNLKHDLVAEFYWE